MLIRAKGPLLLRRRRHETGAGGDGANTDERIGYPRNAPPPAQPTYAMIWDEMEESKKPFVVAHQGPCVGGSLEMSLSCDFRLASTRASYAFPEAKFGLLPATNGISRLTRIVGPRQARLLVMANMPVDAQEARIMGLVHKVFPDESFEEDVMNFCRHLTKQNGEFMGTAKVAIELAADLPAHQAASVERMANSALMPMPSYIDMVTAHVASIGAGKGQL